MFNRKNLDTALYICRIKFPKYPANAFPLYMLVIYFQIQSKKRPFLPVPLPLNVFKLFLSKVTNQAHDVNNIDINNTILINKHFLSLMRLSKTCIISAVENKLNIKESKERIAYVFGANIPSKIVIMTELLYFNLGLNANGKLFVKNIRNNFPDDYVAAEVNLSLVNSRHDIINAVTDVLLQNFFKSPKILYVDDVFYINLQEYGPEFFYSNHKMNEIDKLYFKCNKTQGVNGTGNHKNSGSTITNSTSSNNYNNFYDSKSWNKKIFNKRGAIANNLGGNNSIHNNRFGCYCIIGETTLKQSANCQSFLPKFFIKDYKTSFQLNDLNQSEREDKIIYRCPMGLNKYMDDIENGIKPFLKKGKIFMRYYFYITHCLVSTLYPCQLTLYIF